GAVTGKTDTQSFFRPKPEITRQPATPRSTLPVKCSASIETTPPDSTKPAKLSGRGVCGLKTETCTTRVAPAPVILIEPETASPFGALAQSIETRRRASSRKLPLVRLNLIQS